MSSFPNACVGNLVTLNYLNALDPRHKFSGMTESFILKRLLVVELWSFAAIDFF